MCISIKKRIVLISALAVLFTSCASMAYAAQVYFKVVPSNTPHDEAAVVEVYIDPESQNLNVVEGAVRFEESAEATVSSVVVETGGSALTLWPTLPSYDKKEHLIRFAGGVPNGFTETTFLFRIRIFAARSGNATLSWLNTNAYRNDGAGTKEPVTARSLTLSLTKGTPNIINAASLDSTPPSFVSVEVGRDPNTYDGKYFVSFYAIDDTSGVAHYEVREGGVVTKVENGVYVLNDQERKTPVYITAYDNAGNSRSVQVPHRYQWTVNDILIIVVLMFVIFIGWYVYSKRRKIQI